MLVDIKCCYFSVSSKSQQYELKTRAVCTNEVIIKYSCFTSSSTTFWRQRTWKMSCSLLGIESRLALLVDRTFFFWVFFRRRTYGSASWQYSKFDDNRRAMGMLNPRRDKNGGTPRGGEGMPSVTAACPELRWG